MNKRGDSNKACSWEFFLKKNKKNSMLIRDFRVQDLKQTDLKYILTIFTQKFKKHPIISQFALICLHLLTPNKVYKRNIKEPQETS